MKSYPFPLPESALADFCSPLEGHALGKPFHHEGFIYAGNGYLAIRASKGRWIDDEFPDLEGEAKRRMMSLPWEQARMAAGEWRELDTVRGDLFRSGTIDLWLGDRPAPSPVWRVGKALVRLSHLQRMAMLPRAEVCPRATGPNLPLFFRFSGGLGIIPANKRLTIHSRELFPPQYCPLRGHEIERPTQQFLGLPSTNRNWPPPEPTDD